MDPNPNQATHPLSLAVRMLQSVASGDVASRACFSIMVSHGQQHPHPLLFCPSQLSAFPCARNYEITEEARKSC